MPSQTKKKPSPRSGRGFGGANLRIKSKPKLNKWLVLSFIVAISAFGAWRLFFAAAAPNNCQKDGAVNVCDVDMVAGDTDTVLSSSSEALELGNKGWGTYYGADFRAPTTSLRNAVPVYRVYNEKYSWHDWVTDAQKREKESKYDGNKINEGVAFFAWTGPGEPGTVPVYRLTRGEPHAQSIFSVDKAWVDSIIARDASNAAGWRIGTVLPAIAFYAYPPSYKVANQVNPYDCSIQENFLSDRCAMQRENLTKQAQASTPPRPSTSTPTTTTTPTTAGTPTTSKPIIGVPTVSKPVTAPPTAPPAPAVKYDDCPTAPSMDAGLAAYIDGVNNRGKKYGPDCNTWYLTYAKKKNEAQAIAWYTAVQANIDKCTSSGGRWIDNQCNYDLRNYLNYAKWKSDACLATNQAYDAKNDRCTPLPQTNQFLYTCTIIGKEKISIPKRGEYWVDRTLRFPVYAVDGGKALELCVKWRTGANVQDKYKEFYIPVPGGLVKN